MDAKILSIKRLYADGWTVHDIAVRYEISEFQVLNIVNQKQ
jgi:DNA-binding NarL/FixJ family response regulator